MPVWQGLFAFNCNFRFSRHKDRKFKMQKMKINGCKYRDDKKARGTLGQTRAQGELEGKKTNKS